MIIEIWGRKTDKMGWIKAAEVFDALNIEPLGLAFTLLFAFALALAVECGFCLGGGFALSAQTGIIG